MLFAGAALDAAFLYRTDTTLVGKVSRSYTISRLIELAVQVK